MNTTHPKSQFGLGRRAALIFALFLGLNLPMFSGPTILDAPQEGAVLREYNPVFSWMPDADASDHTIQIAQDVGFNQLVATPGSTIHEFVNRYVPPTGLSPGQYWWRVRAKNRVTGSEGTWSASRSFTVAHHANTILIDATATAQAIQSTIQNATTGSRIVFPAAATFSFSASQLNLQNGYWLQLNNRSDLVIEGNGSTIVFDSSVGNAGFLTATGTTNLSLRNLKLIRAKKLGLVTVITERNDASRSITVSPAQDYPRNYQEDPLLREQYEDPKAWILDGATLKPKFGTAVSVIFDPAFSGPIEPSSATPHEPVWKYTVSSTVRPELYNYLDTGDFVISDNKYGGNKEINLVRCGNVTIYDFDTTATGPTFHLYAERCRNVRVLFCDWLSDGLMGPVSDGMHFKDLREGAWIENNTIISNGDDVIAIRPMNRGFSFTADPTRIRVAKTDDVATGDRLQFFRDNGFNFQGEAEVLSVAPAAGYPNHNELLLDREVGFTGTPQYCNFSLAGPQTVVRGNTFRGARGDAFHMSVNGAIFANNEVSDIGERAFTFMASEGGGSHSERVLIRDNRLKNLKRYKDLQSSAVGSFFTVGNGSSTRIVYDNFLIDGNTISGHPDCAFDIRNARNVRVTNNIIGSGEFHITVDQPHPIVKVSNTDNVVFSGNHFVEYRQRNQAVEAGVTASAVGWSEDNPNFAAQFSLRPWNFIPVNQTAGGTFTLGDPAPSLDLTTFHLAGSGTITGGGTSDKLALAAVTTSGDALIEAKITMFQDPATTDFSRAGLMMRAGAGGNVPFVMISVREQGGGLYVQHIFRPAASAPLAVGTTISGAVSLPIYLRLRRTGATFESSWSSDGKIWTPVWSHAVSLPVDLLTGLGVSSQSATEIAKLWAEEILVTN